MKRKRIFIPGDEWLYYKVYCGERTSDQILVDTIKPLVRDLLDDHYIDKWFLLDTMIRIFM